MKLSTEAARQHIDYNTWATNRLLDAAAALTPEQLQHDFGTADRSIFGTFQHILRSEHAWVNRLEGKAQGSPLPAAETIAQLRDIWTGVHAHWIEFVVGLTQADLDGGISYHDMKGNPWTNTRWEILLHVVNHSTHHRGQVSGFLRASGVTPPTVDYIAFVRQKKS
ncbi:MAG TPA: DinB family protein [Bryobacteraceae bacterium]|jgi:uncharacterized damage-inducible protein DinB|nr:DinB family protein [Bryobacteraceae bacterium]